MPKRDVRKSDVRHETWNSSEYPKWDRYVNDDELEYILDDEDDEYDTDEKEKSMTKKVSSVLFGLVTLSVFYGALLFSVTQILSVTTVGFFDACLIAGAFSLFRITDIRLHKSLTSEER